MEEDVVTTPSANSDAGYPDTEARITELSPAAVSEEMNPVVAVSPESSEPVEDLNAGPPEAAKPSNSDLAASAGPDEAPAARADEPIDAAPPRDDAEPEERPLEEAQR